MPAERLPLSQPPARDERSRVEMTVSCRDCDSIPKVANAGQIVGSDGERIQIMHNGMRVQAGGYYGSWMEEIICRLRGHHEPQEEAVFDRILRHLHPGATMIEIGGFWSYYSLWFLQRLEGAATSIVVEPDPDNLSIGRANAKLNDRHIEFVHASVGTHSYPQHQFQTETAGTISIPQMTVHDLVERYRLAQVDVLHCDAQGIETEVLAACRELILAKKIRFALISTHSHFISGDPLTHQRCLAIVEGYGGQVLAEHDVHESFSGDGLIAAYFGAEPLDWDRPRISYNRYSTSLFRNPLFDLDEAMRSASGTRWHPDWPVPGIKS